MSTLIRQPTRSTEPQYITTRVPFSICVRVVQCHGEAEPKVCSGEPRGRGHRDAAVAGYELVLELSGNTISPLPILFEEINKRPLILTLNISALPIREIQQSLSFRGAWLYSWQKLTPREKGDEGVVTDAPREKGARGETGDIDSSLVPSSRSNPFCRGDIMFLINLCLHTKKGTSS